MTYSHAFLKRCIIARRHALLALPGVHAVILGLKRKGGRVTGRLSVTVFVAKKQAAEEVGQRHVVPQTTGVLFPTATKGLFRLRSIPTDVVETGKVLLHSANTRYDPIPCGVGIGPIGGDFGTLGCLVTDAVTGQRLALTSHHVLFQPGSDSSVICQPGSLSGPNAPSLAIGRAVRGKVSGEEDAEHMDAAVVSVDATTRSVLDTFACGQVAAVSRCTSPKDFVVPMKVHKCGARTGYTRGVITHAIGDYDQVFPPLRSVITIQTEDDTDGPLSDRGDSGSVWIRRTGAASTGEAVALHFAGNESGSLAFACPMWRVIGDPDLNIRL